MASTGPCEYCKSAGSRRGGAEDGLAEDLFVCKACWKLLQSPATAIPLLRGHLTMEMRGGRPAPDVRRTVDAFIEGVAGWRPTPPKS